MKLLATKKRDQNRALLDPWTLVHFSTGLAMGLVRAPFRVSLPAAVAYELLEQYAERRRIGREIFDISGPETVPNSLVDVAIFAAGQWLGRAWTEMEG